MKKSLLILSFLVVPLMAKADVIYFPYQYAFINYSVELIYEYEVVRSSRNTFVYWGGGGIVGSFFVLDKPTAGIEVAFELRRYFKPDSFKNFFLSAYIGTAYMTDLEYKHDLGIVPGLKINHKTQLSKRIVLEPYMGVSLPVSYTVASPRSFYLPFPMLTVGIRLGVCDLKRKE